MKQTSYGILASIDWNSNRWQENATAEDISNCKYEYVKNNKKTHTSFTFADIGELSNEKVIFTLLPQLFEKSIDQSKVKGIVIVFFKSYSWHDKQNYIIGCYAFPSFGPFEPNNIYVNLSSLSSNIVLLNRYIAVKDLDLSKLLPKDKKIGRRSFNYLNKDNVLYLLDCMTNGNSEDGKLKKIKFRILNSISAVNKV